MTTEYVVRTQHCRIAKAGTLHTPHTSQFEQRSTDPTTSGSSPVSLTHPCTSDAHRPWVRHLADAPIKMLHPVPHALSGCMTARTSHKQSTHHVYSGLFDRS